jgi:2-oxoglutarate ferredoxin oxidoreductase subunit gamma
VETRIIVAGSGGQGIVFTGKLLGEAALLDGKNVTCLPAYGAEVRGGTANCTVVISDEEIGSPYVENADILLAMNEPSLKRFLPKVTTGGAVVVNSSLVPDASAVEGFPFTKIAIELGSARAANMVAAGCLAKKTGCVTVASLLLALNHFCPKAEILEMNKKAVQAGAHL